MLNRLIIALKAGLVSLTTLGVVAPAQADTATIFPNALIQSALNDVVRGNPAKAQNHAKNIKEYCLKNVTAAQLDCMDKAAAMIEEDSKEAIRTGISDYNKRHNSTPKSSSVIEAAITQRFNNIAERCPINESDEPKLASIIVKECLIRETVNDTALTMQGLSR